MNYLEVLKNKEGLEEYNIRASVESKKKGWGNSDKIFISTDNSLRYLTSLVQEKSGPKNQYAITSYITTNPNPENKELSIENQSTLLVETYLKILEQEYMKGIYTVINVSDGKTTENHQNWLCLDIDKKELVRFEPSEDFSFFKTKEFCGLVIEKLKVNGHTYTYKIADNGQLINSFSGCRAMSTMLASMYVMGIPLKNTSILRNKKGAGNLKMLSPFTYLMQLEMEKCDPAVSLPRTSRTSGLPFIIIGGGSKKRKIS